MAVFKEMKKKKSGCRGCLKGCLIFFLIITLLIGLLAFFFFRIPEKWGLVNNAAEKHLVTAPDREGGEKLLEEARSRGLSTKGVSLYVFPYKEGEGTVAVAVFDAREGFAFSQGGQLNPIGVAFSQIAGGPTAEDLGIDRVTVMYISGKGQDLMSLSAKRTDALAFSNGQITDKQFMDVLAGDINLPAVLNEQIDSTRRLLEL